MAGPDVAAPLGDGGAAMVVIGVRTSLRADLAVLQVWLNHKMVIDRSNMEYMVETPANRINSVLFHSFFGGSTQDWAPSRQCSISFSEPFVTLVTE